MKTLLILNMVPENLRYCVVDGDYSRFNKVNLFIGGLTKFEREVFDFLYNEDGTEKLAFSKDTNIVLNKDWNFVAQINYFL